MSISLVAGLGNPGREYEKTRHNLGFIVIEDRFPGTGEEGNDVGGSQRTA